MALPIGSGNFLGMTSMDTSPTAHLADDICVGDMFEKHVVR
jgi:hypothetical protein